MEVAALVSVHEEQSNALAVDDDLALALRGRRARLVLARARGARPEVDEVPPGIGLTSSSGSQVDSPLPRVFLRRRGFPLLSVGTSPRAD